MFSVFKKLNMKIYVKINLTNILYGGSHDNNDQAGSNVYAYDRIHLIKPIDNAYDKA